MNNMLFETHMHLLDERFEGDRSEAIERALARGVGQFVEIADSPQDWGRAVELARTRPGQIFVSWGFHPHYAQDWKDDVAQNFLDGSSATELVALGEIGLDSVRSSAPVEIQLPVFKKMLGVAREAALPVVIHCREAFDALWPALEEHCREGKKPEPYWGVIHCFSGGIEDARKAVELGFVLGVDGPVTYPKNEELRRAVAAA
ncbi:MAG: TatD family hydrolase, partial [Elusimicrobia bacterium]|nr:TatD family hydrolase [Elusimicrobiota bacterium]